MNTSAKVATCSYCSTKVVIPLSGDDRHELVCNSCGAPLKNTKLIHKSTPAVSTTKTLISDADKKPRKEKNEDRDRKEKRHRDRRDSEEYKKHRKYKDDDSEKREWSKKDDELRKKYKEYKYRKRKKPSRKRRGLFYWIREVADEIFDIFD